MVFKNLSWKCILIITGIDQLSSVVKSESTNMIALIIFASIVCVICICLICLCKCGEQDNDRRPQSQEQLELRQRELTDQSYNWNII